MSVTVTNLDRPGRKKVECTSCGEFICVWGGDHADMDAFKAKHAGCWKEKAKESLAHGAVYAPIAPCSAWDSESWRKSAMEARKECARLGEKIRVLSEKLAEQTARAAKLHSERDNMEHLLLAIQNSRLGIKAELTVMVDDPTGDDVAGDA